MRSTTKSILLLCVVTLAFAFSGCKKYDEGPGISLASPEGRIEGTWKVTKATETTSSGTSDNTSDYADDTYIFGESGTLTMNFTDNSVTFVASGSWSLSEDDLILNLTYSYVFFVTITVNQDCTIKRLTGKEMILEYVDGGTTYRLEMEKI